jgi:uncharacterized membrane-anchored protein
MADTIGGRLAADLTAHPLRQRALDEIHARPFALVTAPCRVAHFAFMSEGGPPERKALCDWLARSGAAGGLDDETRHLQTRIAGRTFQWERHGEFTTYTLETPDAAAWPADLPQPGDLIVAVAVEVGPDPEPAAGGGMVRARVAGGRAALASTFRANPAGIVEIHVTDLGLAPDQVGPLVQRILEVETYRTLALLGLPEAQLHAPVIRRIEMELPALMQAVRKSDDLQASQELLDRLCRLSAELEHGSAAAAYRFGASQAYA